MKRMLVDTDVVVDYLRGEDQAIGFIKSQASRVVLSAVTVAEVYAGVKDDECAKGN